jgi:hypothetical protein
MSSDAFKIEQAAHCVEMATRELNKYLTHKSHIALYTAGRRLGEMREHIEGLDCPVAYQAAQRLHRHLVVAHHEIVVMHVGGKL